MDFENIVEKAVRNLGEYGLMENNHLSVRRYFQILKRPLLVVEHGRKRNTTL